MANRPRRAARAAFACLSAWALAATAAQAAGHLTVCSKGAPDGFDIAQYETVVTNDAAGIPLYDQLTAFTPGTTEVVPGLAERWDVSADGLAYTLHLRAGVKFHTTAWFQPTRDMNADDVVWSLQRLNDPSHPAHRIAANGFPYWAGMGMRELLKSVDKVDDRTVRLTLTRPDATFLANLTMAAIASVYSAEYGAQLQKAGQLSLLNTQPVGTGPFALKSYQKDANVRYVAHAEHWAGKPAIDTLVFAITPDPAVRAQRLQAGECAAGAVLAEAVPGLRNNPKLALVTNRPLVTSYVAVNTSRPILADRRFREALRLSADQASLIKSAYGGEAVPATSFLPPGLWSHQASTKLRYDSVAARKLVDASGYDGRELKFFVTARATDIRRAAEVLQSDWARIGVKVSIVPMELGELYKRTGQGEHDLVLLSWYSDNGDPDNFFTPNLSCAARDGGGNKARWCHKPFDELIDAARATSRRDERIAYYRRAQRLLADEVPVIPLAHVVENYAVSRTVTGVRLTPFGGQDFRGVK